MARPRLERAQLEGILQAAASVIAAKRIDNLRLIDVARKAGVSTGTLQHYFESREGLIIAAFQWANEAELNRCRELAEQQAGTQREIEVMLPTIIGATEDWSLWSEFWALQSRSPELLVGTPDLFDAWRDLLTDVLTDAVRRGAELTSAPNSLALFIMRYVEGLGVQILTRRITTDEALEDLIQVVRSHVDWPTDQTR